jgi:hypothetical protein
MLSTEEVRERPVWMSGSAGNSNGVRTIVSDGGTVASDVGSADRLEKRRNHSLK